MLRSLTGNNSSSNLNNNQNSSNSAFVDLSRLETAEEIDEKNSFSKLMQPSRNIVVVAATMIMLMILLFYVAHSSANSSQQFVSIARAVSLLFVVLETEKKPHMLTFAILFAFSSSVLLLWRAISRQNSTQQQTDDVKALADKSTYRLAIVTDLDQESKDKSGAQVFWKSYLRFATLQRFVCREGSIIITTTVNVIFRALSFVISDVKTGKYSILFDKSSVSFLFFVGEIGKNRFANRQKTQ
jgi:lysylphosphatidylglycerol synthetase-like protein (DUF2156 family)